MKDKVARYELALLRTSVKELVASLVDSGVIKYQVGIYSTPLIIPTESTGVLKEIKENMTQKISGLIFSYDCLVNPAHMAEKLGLLMNYLGVEVVTTPSETKLVKKAKKGAA
jgi:hypothetical protein